MTPFLSQKMLEEIRGNIQQSLTETFLLMFNLPVVVVTGVDNFKIDQTVCSFIKMEYRDIVFYVSIATSKLVIEMVCGKLIAEAGPYADEAIKDALCELTNIICNRLRERFSSQHDMLFNVSLPKIGEVDQTQCQADILKAFFVVNAAKEFNLGLTHTSAAGTQCVA